DFRNRPASRRAGRGSRRRAGASPLFDDFRNRPASRRAGRGSRRRAGVGPLFGDLRRRAPRRAGGVGTFRPARRARGLAGGGRGLRLVGDVPIFVAGDSADVWTHPELFLLDERRRPRFVAGVPPDYFSATGQLWGNPLYDWPAHRRTGYAWWAARLRATLAEI